MLAVVRQTFSKTAPTLFANFGVEAMCPVKQIWEQAASIQDLGHPVFVERQAKKDAMDLALALGYSAR